MKSDLFFPLSNIQNRGMSHNLVEIDFLPKQMDFESGFDSFSPLPANEQTGLYDISAFRLSGTGIST